MEKNKEKRSCCSAEAFQKSFLSRILLVLFFSLLVMGLAIYFFTRNSALTAFQNSRLVVKNTHDFILPIILFSSFLSICVTLVFSWFMLYVFFHRIAGPVNRVKNHLKDVVSKGDLSSKFFLRADDHVQDLGNAINSMTDSLGGKISELKKECFDMQVVEEELVQLWRSKKDVLHKDLENTIKKFKKRQRLIEEKFLKIRI